MRARHGRSLALYRLLLRGYPRRFRASYEDAILDAFVMERERAVSQRSSGALAAFWASMLIDLAVGVAMTRQQDSWRRIVHATRLIRGSTGFTAALAMLAIIPVWAWSRFATSTPGHARDATLTFWVSAFHAAVIWMITRAILLSYAAGWARTLHLRYASVRRARLVGDVARLSVAIFVAAAIAEARRGDVREALVSPTLSGGFWILLALTLAAIVGLYFTLDGVLRTRS